MSRKKEYVDGGLRVNPSDIQKQVINFIRSNKITLLEGEAGTGKDFCSLWFALNEFKNGASEKVIITKPTVEVGKSVGFLPGTEQEKTQPYEASFIANLQKILGIEGARHMVNSGKLEFEPIGFCRGNTYEYSTVILSEAQNCTLHELISFITRASDTTKIIVNGDILQSDIKNSGYKDLIDILSNIEDVGYFYMGEEFQMRSPLITKINRAYREFLKQKEQFRNVVNKY